MVDAQAELVHRARHTNGESPLWYIARENMGLNEDALARYETFEQSKPAKSYVFCAIDANLRVVGANDLYELAENEDLRADYDAWIAWSAARAILDSVGDDARANSGQINPSVMNETARALIPLVGGPDEVRLVVWGYCLKHDISPQAASPNLATPKNGFDSRQPESDGAEPAVHSDGAASDLAPSNVSQAGLPDKKEAGSGIPWPALIFAVLCFIVTMVFVHWHTPVALHLF